MSAMRTGATQITFEWAEQLGIVPKPRAGPPRWRWHDYLDFGVRFRAEHQNYLDDYRREKDEIEKRYTIPGSMAMVATTYEEVYRLMDEQEAPAGGDEG